MLISKRLFVIAMTTYLTMIVSPCFGQDKIKDQDKNKDKVQSKEKKESKGETIERPVGYLGVQIEQLHPAFRMHLPDLIEHKQGLMVMSVTEASPAAKAGIKPHDILMSYGDQKLFSPEQLEALVHSDKVGTKVPLKIVRDGKALELTVTLDEHEYPVALKSLMPKSVRPSWWSRMLPHSKSGEGNSWSTFDSMKLQSLGEDRFRADISFQTKDGTVQSKTFEGTREEIQKGILGEANLPEVEREHLLRALGMVGRDILTEMPFYFLDRDGRWFGNLPPSPVFPIPFLPEF